MNILIVDDEQMIRNWLTLLFHQITEFPITVFSAENAAAAFEFCKDNSVDLLITDITMPQKSGLELIDEVQKAFPNIKVAVLSAYNNYEYIRHALQHGAIDYILKSEMELDDITALLSKISVCNELSLSADKLQMENYISLQNDNQILSQIISAKEYDIDLCLKNLSSPIFSSAVSIYFFVTDLPTRNFSQALLIQNLLNLTLRGENIIGCAFSFPKAPYFGLIYQPRRHIEEYQKQEFEKLFLLFSQNIEKYYGYRILYDNHTVINTACLPERISKYITLMEMYLFYPKKEIPNTPPVFPANILAQLNRQLNLNTISQKEHLTETVNSIIHSLIADFIPPKDIRFSMAHIITLLFSYLEQNDDLTNSYGAEYRQFIQKANLARTYRDIETLTEQVNSFYQDSRRQKHHNLSVPMQNALQYINNNYSSKITLGDVASHIYLNRTYVSQLFKKQLNISFGEYLEQIRLEKAKRLLETTNLSITEIYEQVGYTSQSYFTKIFKKNVGIGPYKYRMLATNKTE